MCMYTCKYAHKLVLVSLKGGPCVVYLRLGSNFIAKLSKKCVALYQLVRDIVD